MDSLWLARPRNSAAGLAQRVGIRLRDIPEHANCSAGAFRLCVDLERVRSILLLCPTERHGLIGSAGGFLPPPPTPPAMRGRVRRFLAILTDRATTLFLPR